MSEGDGGDGKEKILSEKDRTGNYPIELVMRGMYIMEFLRCE
jgi:hypothetical protein